MGFKGTSAPALNKHTHTQMRTHTHTHAHISSSLSGFPKINYATGRALYSTTAAPKAVSHGALNQRPQAWARWVSHWEVWAWGAQALGALRDQVILGFLTEWQDYGRNLPELRLPHLCAGYSPVCYRDSTRKCM